MHDLVDDILDDLIARVAKVRRWLLALGVLKTAALWLVCISVYIGLYALLDHRVHLGTSGRLLALVLLIGLLAVLSYYLVQTLRRDMTYSRAANHVENKRSFDQQLVAAVEYYEKGDTYPYSKGLARQLVVQVDTASRDFAFDSTVEKWRGYLLAGCVVLCLAVVAVFVHQNIVYFSAYFSRLIRPFSAIAPVPTTTFASITGDVVTAPDVPVTLTAEVKGRLPEVAELVLTRQDPAEPNETLRQSQRIAIHPTVDADGNVTLTAAPSFAALGHTTYRFETPDANSETHTITVAQPPTIESITALVSLPSEDEGQVLAVREEKIEDRTLAVLPSSRVELRIETTTPVREATACGLGKQPAVQTLNGARTFSVRFTADQPMALSFCLLGVEGLANSEPEELRVVLKADEPPQFKLRSPEGDCLATDVASVPVAFEITDDFGLEAAQLYCELPSGECLLLDTNDPQGARQARVSYTLELERYDLMIGDSVLYYAQARDIATEQKKADANCCSDIYFVEIRPYRQYWHPQPGGGPSNTPGAAADDLGAVLEYTRAILKKTWALAQTPVVIQRDRPKSEALSADVEYCIQTLTSLRDDPEAGFDDSMKAKIDEVIDLKTQAQRRLSISDANGALSPERDAYRLLRKLIDELHLKWNPPQSGQSVPQEKPERITLRENPDVETPQDQQRIENQLEKAQQKIDKLAREQKALRANLAKSFQEQSQSGGESQASESSSPSSGNSGQSSGSESQASDQQGDGSGAQVAQNAADQESQESTKGEEGQEGREGVTTEQMQSDSSGADSSASESQGQANQQDGAQKQTTEGSRGSQGQGQSGKGQAAKQGAPSHTDGSPSAQATADSQSDAVQSSAAADVRMRMLEARQKALRAQAAEVAQELAQMALPESSRQAGVRDQAKQRLDEAVENMKTFEEKLADLRYEPSASADKQAQMADLADAAARELVQAGEAIERGLSAGKPMTEAEKAEALARQLAEDAASLDESVSPEEREEMLERLKAAERLLESMATPQWANVSRGGGPGLVYTRGDTADDVKAARLLAQQFWSIAIQARDRQVRPVEDEPSDVEFVEAENEFFENAAKFKPQGDPK
ncbi:MAG: hypothetical protein JW993_00765 [Sedimentisphaerales bacterium]|nr:hypothetical protein [Sedimentisphaerales bacterium]